MRNKGHDSAYFCFLSKLTPTVRPVMAQTHLKNELHSMTGYCILHPYFQVALS